MSDIMRSVPFEELLSRIFGEYRQCGKIFGLHKDQFYKNNGKTAIEVFGQKCATPLGPAAGPHTQLAQNIVASYLVGGRFIELKTVQILDELEIDKPCIDVRDEGYNVEWSSEYTLPKAYDEYAKAWVLLHLLEALLEPKFDGTPSFIFNMSVGYNLEGILTPKMQTFIDSMIDSSKNTSFKGHLDSLEAILAEGSLFNGTEWEGMEGRLKGLSKKISPKICSSVTLSTMHGCPPKEIEAICSYMLSKKKLNTFVKLNPTLLGFDRVRSTLDELGYKYITLKPQAFEVDLQYGDAIPMLERLVALSQRDGLGFGVKLTNTLGSVNDQGFLPGDEMYMSGRALLPLSVAVGALLTKEFKGTLPISYSGGATASTIVDLFECGIRPITLATDLLKPGGYVRLKQMVELLEERSESWGVKTIDLNKIEALAESSLTREDLHKDYRGHEKVEVEGRLPLTDCYVAPCIEACPIHQNIPDYIYLVGQGRYADALEVIYETNALPNLTGYICDHQCQYHCTRLDYEGTVQIREMKKIAVEEGFAEYVKRWERPEQSSFKAAVVGAGPAGLSAAYFLARSGFVVTLFEREKDAGGVTRYVIPSFRFPASALQGDIDFIAEHGVEFKFSTPSEEVTIEALKQKGFDHIFYAIGAEVDNIIPLTGDRSRIYPSLPFLAQFNRHKERLNLGKRVVVVGGGNTAMDGARAAIRVEGVEEVSVLYRRTENEMPADREEYHNALQDGVKFYFLTNPESFNEDGTLVCRKMALGEKDASNRRSPVATDETITLQVDSLITAIGEKVDSQSLTWFGLPVDEKGWPIVNSETFESRQPGVYVIGDAQSGPSTVVRCIAAARSAVEAAIDSILGPPEEDEHDHFDEEIDSYEIEVEENAFFKTIRDKKGYFVKGAQAGESVDTFTKIEAARCLECSYVCDKCVEVCPNRANVAIDMRYRWDLFENPFQIVHLDAFCNECGNCTTFCPWSGSPYKDKFTLFSRLDDFESSENSGFFLKEGEVLVRYEGEITKAPIESDGKLDSELPEEVTSRIEEIILNHAYLLGAVEA